MGVGWTLAVGFSVGWETLDQRRSAVEVAHEGAVTAYESDQMYRRWAMQQGGVYVPLNADDRVPSSVRSLPEGVVTTQSGRMLTLIDPPHMARAMYQPFANGNYPRARLTSLNAADPENSPDAWEAAALRSMAGETKEVYQVVDARGERVLRLMRPVFADPACLSCHAAQGYREGDILGGVSITVPMAAYDAVARANIRKVSIGYGVLWIFGLVVIGAGSRHLHEKVLERERARAALLESDERFRSVVENAPESIYVQTQGRFRYLNPAALRLFGATSASQLFGESFIERLHPDVRPVVEERARSVTGGCAAPLLEEKYLKLDGTPFDVEVAAVPFTHDGENSALVFFHDITGRKQADQALRESEEKYRRIVETASEGIWILDNENRTTFANRRLAEMLGYSAEEMIGRSVFDFIEEEQHALVAEEIARRRHGIQDNYEFRFRRKDGQDLWAIVSASPVPGRDREYAGALAMITDMTERRRLEEQFRQAQKMEAIGQLAGGVAHDFNNLLTVINGYSSLLLKTVGLTDSVKESLAEIAAAGERAAGLTQQLLAFSRKQIIQPRAVDLNAVVRDIEKMLFRLIGAGIDLSTVLAPDLAPVHADPGQMQQVLMNLAVNARDAMPDGGALQIETANLQLDEGYAAVHPEVEPGSYVMLAVSDSGAGMDEITRTRLFEPFFTTKEPGKGTGLGLSTVYGIVKQAGGHISMCSEPGKGTTFKIYLPALKEAFIQAPEPVAEAPGMSCGNETILVVEDQREVRTLVCGVLNSCGYAVLEAASPREAILLSEQHREPIALMVTDVVMPGMTGRELADRLAECRPEMKVLYMSGYTDNAIVHQRVLDSGMAYLQKPFTPDALAVKVREILSSPRTTDRILVVDDDAAIRRVLRQVLTGYGYEVSEAADGNEALTEINRRTVSLVITDLAMPEKEGLETIREIRRDHRELKVIAMSGAFGPEMLETAEYLGADDAMMKPISAEVVLEKVRTLLN